MTIIRAKVTKEFDGVEDGKVYPRKIEAGEEVSGALAESAIRQKFAKETAQSKAARGAAAAEESEIEEKDRLAAEALAAAKARREADLAVLSHFNLDELTNIAAKNTIDIANLKTADEVMDAIQRDLVRLELNAADLKPDAAPTGGEGSAE